MSSDIQYDGSCGYVVDKERSQAFCIRTHPCTF